MCFLMSLACDVFFIIYSLVSCLWRDSFLAEHLTLACDGCIYKLFNLSTCLLPVMFLSIGSNDLVCSSMWPANWIVLLLGGLSCTG
jgi:hypothetical protein